MCVGSAPQCPGEHLSIRETVMQAELEKVSSLLDAATKSFRSNVSEDGCTQLSEAAAILEQIIAASDASATDRMRSRSAVA
jgi:hypothetical protein